MNDECSVPHFMLRVLEWGTLSRKSFADHNNLLVWENLISWDFNSFCRRLQVFVSVCEIWLICSLMLYMMNVQVQMILWISFSNFISNVWKFQHLYWIYKCCKGRKFFFTLFLITGIDILLLCNKSRSS